MYIGVNGKARKVKKIYIGVDNVARKVTKGYIGWGGKARQWWPNNNYDDDTITLGRFRWYPYYSTTEGEVLTPIGYITKVTFVDSYTPTETPDERWCADTGNTGAYMGYRYGTEVIISGNGTGKIKLPYNAYGMFSNLTNLTTFEGLTLLDSSEVYEMAAMFYGCPKISELDLTSFDTSNVESYTQAFANCSYLYDIYVSNKWTILHTDLLTEGSPVDHFTYV